MSSAFNDNNNFHNDSWLSEIMNKNVFRFSPDKKNIDQSLDVLRKNSDGNLFVYCKVNTADAAILVKLQNSGFYVIDTNVQFEKPIAAASKLHFENIRLAYPEDKDQIEKIAGENFVYSRFHLDPKIDLSTAARIKSEWAGNFFSGKRGNYMIVHEQDGIITGFCQLLKKDNEIIIDLIAVDKTYQNKGIAGAILNFIETYFSFLSKITVGTQIANIPSVRCYEKSGFRLTGSQYVLHYHS